MNKIIKKFWGVAIVAILLSTLFVAAPASAVCPPYVALPTATAGSPIGITAIGTTVYDYAVAPTNQNLIWAATSDNALMSSDQGRTWSHIYTGSASGDDATQLVCIAPDDSNVIVYVSNLTPAADALRTVKITMNGGLNWFDLETPENLAGLDVYRIWDIDISETFTDLYGYSYRYIGVAGQSGNVSGNAAFYYIKFGAYATSAWRDAVVDATPPLTTGDQGYTNTTGDKAFVAVKFSPHFKTDNIAYLMSTNGTAVDMHVISLNIAHRWNTQVSGYNIFGYSDDGVAVTTVTGSYPFVAKGQLIFAPDFNGVFYDPSYPRICYWSVAGSTSGGGYGVFKEDINGIPLSTPTDTVASWSIALNPAGTVLIAGRAYTNQTPGGGLGLIMKRIGFGNVAFGGIDDALAKLTVFYAGTNLLCASQGDQNAFSLSLDNGKTWNDISLVNTSMRYIDDFAVEAAGIKTYIVSHGYSDDSVSGNNYAASVWYWDGTYWERVYLRADTVSEGAPVPTHRYIIKASPDNFGVVYLGDAGAAGAGTIYYSPDYGKESWRQRTAPLAGTILKDLEIVDDANLYAATNVGSTGYVCPLTFSGQYWNASDYIPVFGAGTTIFSITLVSDDSVVAGGASAGKVAYTTTGGNTPPEWTVLNGALPAGNVVCEALSLAAGSTVYATSTLPGYAAIYTYVLGSSLSVWTAGHASILAAASPTTAYSLGLLIYGTGIGQSLYYLSGNGSGATAVTALERAFLPPGTFWCTLLNCTMWGASTPDAIKGTGSDPVSTLWFTDRYGMNVWPYPMRGFGETVGVFPQIKAVTDTYAYYVPAITGPANGFVVLVNAQTGIAYDITLTWVGGPMYVVVAKDAAFLDVKAAYCVPSPINIGPHAINSNMVVNWQPGETYYIKIGSCDYCMHWSAPISVTVMGTPLPIPEINAPECGGVVSSLTPALSWSPMAGATAYTVQLATRPDFATATLINSYQVTGTTGFQVPVDTLIDGSTYYWRVSAGTAAPFMWSATCSFTVTLPTEPPTVTTTSYIAPSSTQIIVPTDAENVTVTQTSQAYIWAVIVIGAVLVVAIIVLIFRTRRS
jgi:hypothetical protein